MIFLKSLTMRERDRSDESVFPFTLGVVTSLRDMEFNSPVAFFVGENGSGKSTILEALACAIGSVTVGSESLKTDPSLESVRRLSRYFRLSWLKRTHKGFFLRAEDFFSYAKAMRQSQEQMQAEMTVLEREARRRSEFAAVQTRAPYTREISANRGRYGDGLDARSHGESFMLLFQTRFVPGGLYLLDEPEAALSPSRQLSFLAALNQMAGKDSQFIVATHSPIILSFPGAAIWSFDGGVIHQARYEDLEHVRLTRDFLQNPQAFFRHLQ
jgi:predicted ATPase